MAGHPGLTAACGQPLAPAAQAFREEVVGDALGSAVSSAGLRMRIAGCSFRFDFVDDDLRELLLPALRHHVTDAPDGGTPSLPETRIVVWGGSRPGFPWSRGHLGRGGAVAGLSQGPVRAIAAADGSSLMLWDGERRLACCWFDGVGGVTRWDRAAPLRSALHFALAAPNRQLVHSAAVGANGRGVLLAGPGGSGKSTTTLACHQAGLHVVGDDYTALELIGDRATAWNLYSSIKVGERGPGDRDDRRTLILGEDLAGQPADSLDLVAVLLPRVVAREKSTLGAARAGEALRALGPSTMLQAPYEDRPTLGLLGDLARRLPAQHLYLGADRGVPAIRSVVAP